MNRSIVKYIGDQPFMKVLRAFVLSSRPRYLRELATQFGLSASGTSDILKRLQSLRVLKARKVKNRICYSLNLEPEEGECLKLFFSSYERAVLIERAQKLSKGAIEKLSWMDETYVFYRAQKRKRT